MQTQPHCDGIQLQKKKKICISDEKAYIQITEGLWVWFLISAIQFKTEQTNLH